MPLTAYTDNVFVAREGLWASRPASRFTAATDRRQTRRKRRLVNPNRATAAKSETSGST
jgi:hypothetical protein